MRKLKVQFESHSLPNIGPLIIDQPTKIEETETIKYLGIKSFLDIYHFKTI